MRRLAICMLLVTCVALRAGPAVGADQLVLGDTFVLLNSDLLNQRAANASALERNATATIVGDPTQTGSAGGAILTLIADGGTPSSQTFSLPQGTRSDGKPFWTAVGTRGFAYADPAGEQGPVRLVVITKSDLRRFIIQAAAVGNATTLDVAPPNPGTDAFMTLKLGLAPDAGDRYCVQYGPESKIVNIGDLLFSASNPKVKGCPPTGPTTTTLSTTTSTSSTTTSTSAQATPTTSSTTASSTTTSSTTASSTTTTPTTSSTTSSTTTTTTSTTTSTTHYGSPSRAFLAPIDSLLD